MSKDFLVDIVDDCCSKVLQLTDVQLAVCKMANYLIKKEQRQKDIEKVKGLRIDKETKDIKNRIDKETKGIKDRIGKEIQDIKDGIDKETKDIKDGIGKEIKDIKNRIDKDIPKFDERLKKQESQLWKLNRDLDDIKLKIEKLKEECRSINNSNDFEVRKMCVGSNSDYKMRKQELVRLQLQIRKQELAKLQLDALRQNAIKKENFCQKYGLPTFVNSLDWANHDSYKFDTFKFFHNKIQLSSSQSRKIFGAEPIVGSFAYKFQIIKNGNLSIVIGLSNIKNIREIYFNYNSFYFDIPYRITGGNFEYGYFYKNGESCKKSKQKLKTKQLNRQYQSIGIVQIFGSVKSSKIVFKINEIYTLQFEVQDMKNEDIVWVPVLYLKKEQIYQIIHSYPQLDLLPFCLAENMFEWDFDMLYGVYQFIKESDLESEAL